MRLLSFLALGILLSTGNSAAQVTIGSNLEPTSGAILDLKQEDKKDGSANSKKGLGLPRVILKSLSLPDKTASLATTIDQATGDWDSEEHIGLVVYNIQAQAPVEVCPVDPDAVKTINVGPYVWDGNEWQYLIRKQATGEQGDIQYVYGRKNEKYPYRAFGDPNDPDNFAGYWTLENARYIDGSMTRSIESIYQERNYQYPNATDTSSIPATWRPNQGLLYSYSAATLGAQDAIWNTGTESQGQESGTTETTPVIQGVCPEGWHIPTDREWNMLAKVIFNNPEKYSAYAPSFGLGADSVQWDPEAEIGDKHTPTLQGMASEEAGLGITLLSPCSPLLVNNNNEIDRIESVGKSKPATTGGFNALLVGCIGTESTAHDTYNLAVTFWTSSVADTEGETAWGRMISIEEAPQALIRLNGPITDFCSIRCKKD